MLLLTAVFPATRAAFTRPVTHRWQQKISNDVTFKRKKKKTQHQPCLVFNISVLSTELKKKDGYPKSVYTQTHSTQLPNLR